MTETIGTARLDIVVDTAKMEAGVDTAIRKTREYDNTSQQSTQKQEQNSRRQVASLEKQIATFGKSRDEVIRWRIEQQTSGAVAAQLTAKLDAQVIAARKGAVAFNQYGLSAKQQAAALRQVPAQVTDIFTSLASGQRPLTVLLQQGGQLKDIFGGAVPAMRAMGGALLGLINPITITLGVIAGLGIAWKEAAEEGEAFERALILTGNQADLTADQLRGMASQLDGSTNATGGKASEVLAQVAATGKFTAEQIGLVAEAAINLEDATGRAIEKTISEFVELEKAPVDAILKLNDAIGDGTNVTNFLTEAQLKAIDKFKEQGNEAEAARIAIEAYADAINDRAPQVVENLTLFSSLWREIKNRAKEAGDAFVDAFRQADAEAKNLLQSRGALTALVAASPFIPGASTLAGTASNSGRPGAPDFSNVRAESNTFVDTQAFKERKKAEEEFDRLALSNLDKKARLESEIKQIREIGQKAGKSELEIEKQIANARQRYQESLPKPRKPRNNDRSIQNASDRFDDMVGRFQAELQGPLEKAEQEHLKRMRELGQAAKEGKRSHEELAAALGVEGEAYKKATEEIQHRFDAEVAGLLGPIAQAQDTHEQALRRIDELKRQGALTAEEYTVALLEEAKAYELDRIAAERAADPLSALLEDMQLELEMIGKSNAQRAVMIELRRLNKDVMSDEGQAALATAKAFEEEARAKQRSIDLMDTFRDGAADALSDFVTGAKSAKDAFKDFFDSIAEAITRAIAEQWIEKLLGASGTDGSGSSGGDLLGWIMGAFTGQSADFGFAKGAAFAGGNVIPFAHGGVIDGPTNFPMSGGRLGLMGEAGPEAIMPLARGSDGKLGVRMEGAGPSTFHQINNIVVQGRLTEQTAKQAARESGMAARREMART